MLVIRLRRTGRKKAPKFRVVVAEKTMPIYGRFVDIIGQVDLQAESKVIEINKEKAQDWMKKGAQPTDTVARLMVKAGILKKDDLNWKPDKKRKKRAEAKKEAKEGAKPISETTKSEEKTQQEVKTEEKPVEKSDETPKEEPKKEEKVEEKTTAELQKDNSEAKEDPKDK